MKRINLFILFILLSNSNTAFGEYDRNYPSIQSEAAIVLEVNSGEVLYEKNSTKSMYPASLTKIATAIYAIEKGNLADIVEVSHTATKVDGTRVYLEEGERVSLEKLIQGLLINSGNDAGVAIAEHMDGTLVKFAQSLNEYLIKDVGLKNTNFENPHGLFNTKHVTSAEDLARLTQYALKNNVFQSIIGTKELEWKGNAWETTLYTHHKFMREEPYQGIVGGKTGFVDQSGHTLVTIAERDNLYIIVVTLKAASKVDIYKDTKKLLDYGFETFQTIFINEGRISYKNNIKYRIPYDVFYTLQKGKEWQQTVNDKGELEIRDSTKKLIKTVQLDTMLIEQENNELSMPYKSKEQFRPFFLNITIIPIILIGLVTFLSFYRKK